MCVLYVVFPFQFHVSYASYRHRRLLPIGSSPLGAPSSNNWGVSAACRAIFSSGSAHYNYKKTDPAFHRRLELLCAVLCGYCMAPLYMHGIAVLCGHDWKW